MRIVAVTVAVILLSTPLAYAQPDSELQAGKRLRIKSGDSLTEYVLERITADSLIVSGRNNDGMRQIAFDQVQRVDVRVPRSAGRGALRGAVFGGMIGAVIGGSYAISTWDEVDADCGRFTPLCSNSASALRFAGYVAVFGMPGMLVGAVVGGISPGERWQPVNLPGRFSMSVGGDRTLFIQYSLAF
jgi:hypothetical protein